MYELFLSKTIIVRIDRVHALQYIFKFYIIVSMDEGHIRQMTGDLHQVIKQLIGNTNASSILDGWRIFYLIVVCFPPSLSLHPLITSFLNRSCKVDPLITRDRDEIKDDSLHEKIVQIATLCKIRYGNHFR